MVFSFQNILSATRKRITLIVLFVVFATTIATIISFLLTPYYKSTISIYRTLDNKGMNTYLKDLTSLGSMMGFNIGGEQSPFYIPDIVKSRRLKTMMLESLWQTKKFDTRVTLVKYWKTMQKDSPLQWFTNYFLTRQTDSVRADFETAVEKLNELIKVEEQESGLFVISVWAEEPQLAADMANFIAEYIREYIAENTTMLTSKNRQFMEERLAFALKELTASEDKLTEFRKVHPITLDTPELQLQRGRLTRAVEVNQQVYITLRQQFEIARIDELSERSVLKILDRGEAPLKKERPQRSLIILGAFFVSYIFILYVSILLERKKRYGSL
ncbi:MAG: hypothetical protein HYZ34_08325 [Ignavibacteriae bacterium]|nr:hypothetical protein [Ignavibacteriota bacterium]